MTALAALYASHPMWAWATVAALLLAIEVATGSGWLLWPSACAAAVGIIALTRLNFGPVGDIALFAGLTIVTTLLARRFVPGLAHSDGGDINDRAGRLAGETGVAAGAFSDGQGRVLVGGAEWAAQLQDGGEAPVGARLTVVRVLDGSKLLVARA